jgi:hypothetical protein
MGLLDDAIREHLDLKRRRGADPAEVARLEHEALGPVRREPATADAPAEQPSVEQPAAEAAQPEHAEHPQPAHEDQHPDEHTHVLPPEERHEPPHGDPLFEQHAHNVELGGAAAEPEPSATDADRAGGDEDARPAGESRTGAHPESSGPARGSVDPKVVDQPTTEYRVEDHEDPADDVLEETPDFLQETPEHDRLWFEQRPPRDFDFDG